MTIALRPKLGGHLARRWLVRQKIMTPRAPLPPYLSARSLAVVALTLTAVLAGCGDKSKDKAPSQTAAKVNKEEITVHQINLVLSQQRAQSPEQSASAAGVVLERLIDQELAL